ncbi:MAG: phosphatase PAP2 family protein [Patescibacteria group bacterium]
MELIIIFFAKYLGYILLAAFLILFLNNQRKDFLIVPLFSALLSRFVFTEIIRFFYFRQRPFVVEAFIPLINHAPTASFPSGHAAFFFALSAGIYSFNKKAGLWFFAASSLLSFARVFAGLHYFTDVLGGFIVGFLSYLLVKKLSSLKLL